jgi:hypothetical protein
MGVRPLGNGAEFFHDMRRRRAIGITHTEIDNIFAAPTRSHFQFSSNVKNVRRRRSIRVKRRSGLDSAIGSSD